jgi:hypothetical protein
MEFLKKHVDTVVVLGGVLSSVLWMNHKFSDVDKKLVKLEQDMDSKFAKVEQDMAIIKTVLIMKNIMPSDLASRHDVTSMERDRRIDIFR